MLFTTHGVAYTCRFVDVPASTGYGEPVQRLFKFKDGERVVAVMSLDPRVSPGLQPKKDGDTPPRHAFAATTDGYALRFSLAPFVEPSTRAGRKFVKMPDGVEIEECAWFDLDALPKLPPPISISRRLIDTVAGKLRRGEPV